MKETYLRIFSNAKQEVGLPAPTPEQVTVLNNQASQLAAEMFTVFGVCCGDGNQNAPTYQEQPGDIPGYACCGNEFEGTYNANPWLYPYDIDNLQFTVDLPGEGFNPCEFGKGGPLEFLS